VGANIIKSTDGLSWVNSTNNSFIVCNDICWSGMFVAVGQGVSGEDVATSTDGMIWNFSTVTSGIGLTTCSNGSVFLVSSASNIFYSTNGVSWSSVTSPFTTMIKLNFVYDKFIALGDNSIAYSFDAQNWYVSSIVGDSFTPVCIVKSNTERKQISTENGLRLYTEVFQEGLCNFTLARV
jgi:hypothetical protein